MACVLLMYLCLHTAHFLLYLSPYAGVRGPVSALSVSFEHLDIPVHYAALPDLKIGFSKQPRITRVMCFAGLENRLSEAAYNTRLVTYTMPLSMTFCLGRMRLSPLPRPV